MLISVAIGTPLKSTVSARLIMYQVTMLSALYIYTCRRLIDLYQNASVIMYQVMPAVAHGRSRKYSSDYSIEYRCQKRFINFPLFWVYVLTCILGGLSQCFWFPFLRCVLCGGRYTEESCINARFDAAVIENKNECFDTCTRKRIRNLIPQQ